MKTFALIVVGMLLAGGVLAALKQLPTVFAAKTTIPSVRVETVSSGELIETVSAPGEVQPRTKVSISAKVSAPITILPFEEGDWVAEGDVIVWLDSKDLEAARNSAKWHVIGQENQMTTSDLRCRASNKTFESLNATYKDAVHDLKRQNDLLQSKDISQSAFDTASAKVDSLEAQVRAADFTRQADVKNRAVEEAQLQALKADLAKAEDDLEYTAIRSPISGVVTRRKAQVGEMVVPGIQGSPGTTIMEVADLSDMLMIARVDESSVTRVVPEKKQKAIIRMQAYPDIPFEGEVEWVANSRADPTSSAGGNSGGAQAGDGSRYFECKIRLNTGGRDVKAGLSADADIEVNRQNGLKVPSQAVVGRPTDSLPADVRTKPEVNPAKSITTVVYKLVNGKAVVTPVIVGPSDETHTLITSGLSAGDRVITGPFKVLESISHGQEVTEEPSPAKPAAPTTMPSKPAVLHAQEVRTPAKPATPTTLP